jgi:hypothetical protein
MDNTVQLSLNATPVWDLPNNQQLISSAIDELLFFSNDTDVSRDGAVFNVMTSCYYIPENLGNYIANTTSEILVRQDVKRRIASRLPRVTLGQGLFIWSLNDDFSSYFINSVVLRTPYGYIRWGLANFTSDQATNPLAPGQQGVLNALWSFFEIPETL